MQQIHRKKNEKQEVEFYKDKECTEAFDFTNAKDLYIELVNGDLSLLFYLNSHLVNKDLRINNLMIPHIVNDENILYDIDDILKMRVNKIYTLGNDAVSSLELQCIVKDAVPNLSKYIPEDNAVLFLNEEDRIKFVSNDNIFNNSFDLDSFYKIAKLLVNPPKKLTIFLRHGTQAELQKAKEVAKELNEKYGVEEVNFFALHWFGRKKDIKKYLPLSTSDIKRQKSAHYNRLTIVIGQGNVPSYLMAEEGYARIEREAVLHNANIHFSKIITTNSTGMLPVGNAERLQVIDCFDIFQDHWKDQ